MQFTKPQSILLDLCRGGAAQLVLVGHAMSIAKIQDPNFLIQDLGVATFFILSGLLITLSVLSKDASYGFTEYLIDRGARIFVPYVPAVIYIVIMSLWFLGGPTDPFTVIANLLMLEDFPLFHFVSWFPEIDRVGTGRPLWSVAMEWWFYMAAAFAFFAGRLPRWSWLLIVPGLFVMAYNMSVGALGIVWIAGGCIAAIFFRIPKLPQWFWMALSIAGGVLAHKKLELAQGSFYDLQFSLLLGFTLVCALKAVERWDWLALIEKPVTFVAGFSYTLYLTHYTVMSSVVFEGAPHTRVWIIFILSNALAITMWFLFERHHRTVARWLKARVSRESSAQPQP